MNGAAQRERHTAVQTVQTQLDQLTAVVEAIDVNTAVLAQHTTRELQRATDATRAWADATTTDLTHLSARVAVFESMTRWQRLKWLFGY